MRSTFSQLRKVIKNSGYITPHQKEPSPEKYVSVHDDKLKAITYLYRFR